MINTYGEETMLKCGTCQQIISWSDSKSILVEEHLSCPYCKEGLVFSNHAKAIADILIIFVNLIYACLFSIGFFENSMTALISFVPITILTFMLKKHFIYGVSLLFPLVPEAEDSEKGSFF